MDADGRSGQNEGYFVGDIRTLWDCENGVLRFGLGVRLYRIYCI